MRKSTCFFVNSSPKFAVYLLGGVLSMLAFALISNPVSAYNVQSSVDSFNISGSSSDLRFISKHNIRGGCEFRAYDLSNGSAVYLGDLRNDTNMCGYRYVNNGISYYDDRAVGYNNANYNGSSISYSTQQNSGYNILSTWTSDVISNYGGNIRNTLHDIDLTANTCPSGSSVCANTFNTYSDIDGSAIFVYRYKPNNTDYVSAGNAGVIPRFQAVSYFNMLDRNNNSVPTSEFSLTDYQDEISSSIVWGAFNADELENYLPENLRYLIPANNAEQYQFIIGSIPIYRDYHFNASTLHIQPEDGIKYSWDLDTTGVLNGKQYDFLHYSPTYKQGSGGIGAFSYDSIGFAFSVCENTDECSLYENFTNLYKEYHSNGLKSPTPANGNTSIFMGWFDVFNFGLFFPFRNLFNAFTDSTSCVDVPIIGGMLSNPNARYCSWWSSDIRAIITPVFSLASIMLIFGFIIHWLRNGETTAIATKERKGSS